MNIYRAPIKIVFTLLFFVLSVHTICGQIADKSIADSLRLLPVKLTDIPIRSAETLMQNRKILDNLISPEEIATFKSNNDSILGWVEKENKKFLETEVESKSIRYFHNRSLQIQNQKEIVEDEKRKLSKIITDLEESIKYFTDEQTVWSNTKAEVSKSGYSKTIVKRIDLILENLNNSESKVSLLVEDLLIILDRNSELSINMDGYLLSLDKSIQELENQILLGQHPSIFNLNYSADNIKSTGAFKNYIVNEWLELKSYSKGKLNLFIITFILFVLLLFLFLKYQDFFKDYRKNTANFYKRKTGVILSRPLSTAFILTLLSTVLIFPNRPPAFRDLSMYMAIIPLIIILYKLLQRKLFFIVCGFTVTMLLNVIFEILPPENIIFRYNLFFIALVEIFLTWIFLYKTVKNLTDINFDQSLFKILGYLILIMAIIGFYSSVSGNVMLAQKMLTSINFGIVVWIIQFASVITINGLIIALIESKAASKINFIRNFENILKKKVIKSLNVMTVIFAVSLFLNKLNVWKILKDSVLDFFMHQRSILEIKFSFGEVFIFFLVIYLSILIAKFIQIILENDVLSRMKLSKGMPYAISMMVKYSLITIGLFLAIYATGLPFSSLTVIIGAFGVGIGFGLQNIFNNLVSGIILLFERPIQIGDTVEVGALLGKVKSIGIRASNIKTFDGAEVIVPNGQLISKEVINWTLSDQQKRIEVIIGVSYNSDPHRVHELLLQVLTEHKKVMQFPTPNVLFNELGESSIDFRLLFWTDSFGEWLNIKSEVIFRIFDLLKENNIEIPYPQRVLHLNSIEKQFMVNSKNSSEPKN